MRSKNKAIGRNPLKYLKYSSKENELGEGRVEISIIKKKKKSSKEKEGI